MTLFTLRESGFASTSGTEGRKNVVVESASKVNKVFLVALKELLVKPCSFDTIYLTPVNSFVCKMVAYSLIYLTVKSLRQIDVLGNKT